LLCCRKLFVEEEKNEIEKLQSLGTVGLPALFLPVLTWNYHSSTLTWNYLCHLLLCFDISYLAFHADLGTCSHVVPFDLVNKLQIAYV